MHVQNIFIGEDYNMAVTPSLFDSIVRALDDCVINIDELQRINTENTEHINYFISKHRCNIVNYMPMDLMTVILHKQYDRQNLKYPLQLFYKGQLYTISDGLLDLNISACIEADIVYATTVKIIPIDFLEAYRPHSYGGL
jgi:hypothetical protein